MSLSFTQLHPTFVAEVSGVDLTRPLDPDVRARILEAGARYGVLVFRDTGLSDEGHVAFSRIFGELELAPKNLRAAGRGGRLPLPELFDAGNLDGEGRINQDELVRLHKRGDRQWHTDTSFMETCSSWSLLLAHETPSEGGSTWFADTRAAYDALPVGLKERLEGLEVQHSIWYSRMTAGYPFTEEDIDERPSAVHPLVHTHVASGRKALYIASHARDIVGWPREEGRKLLRELIEFATQPRFTFQYHWRPGDLVAWDNLCTMHRAGEFDDLHERRDMRRTTVRAPEGAKV